MENILVTKIIKELPFLHIMCHFFNVPFTHYLIESTQVPKVRRVFFLYIW